MDPRPNMVDELNEETQSERVASSEAEVVFMGIQRKYGMC